MNQQYREALIAAWEAWDERPGNEITAQRLEDLCTAYVGGPAQQLRVHMAAACRVGLSRQAALTEWELLEGS